jgi:hypothetical protein
MVWFWDISLRGFAPLFVRGEPSKTLSLFAAPFWSEFCCALIVRCAFWFYTLVIEGLRPSNSSQAFRERLEPKLSSLAFYPKYSYVIFLPIIMNYEL